MSLILTLQISERTSDCAWNTENMLYLIIWTCRQGFLPWSP